MPSLKSFLLVSGAALLCIARAGGDGASDDKYVTNTTGVPPALAIDQHNAPTVAGQLIIATLELETVGNLLALVSFGSGPRSPRVTPPAAASRTKTPFDEILTCRRGGFLTMAGEVADVNSLNPGDVIATTLASCDEGALLLNGSFESAVSATTDDARYLRSGRFFFSADLNVRDFTLTKASGTVVADGDLALAIDTTSATAILLSLSGSAFCVAVAGDTLTLADYDIFLEDDASTLPIRYRFSTNGTGSSTSLPGSVKFVTLVPFERFADAYPHVGRLRATGAHNTSVVVTARDNTALRLEIDSDGDGEIDEVIETTWQAITTPLAEISASLPLQPQAGRV